MKDFLKVIELTPKLMASLLPALQAPLEVRGAAALAPAASPGTAGAHAGVGGCLSLSRPPSARVPAPRTGCWRLGWEGAPGRSPRGAS